MHWYRVPTHLCQLFPLDLKKFQEVQQFLNFSGFMSNAIATEPLNKADALAIPCSP
jgi:hypothetical protein